MNEEISIRTAAQEFLDELESSRLEVILVPQRVRTNEGGMVRVAVSKNVRWYRAFCAAYPTRRVRRNLAPDTLIKRKLVLSALRAMAAGRPGPSCYGYRLAPLLEVRAAKMARALIEAGNPF